MSSEKKKQSPEYNGYVESDYVKQAKQNLSSLQKPSDYQSQWQNNLNDVINKIQNREKFNYDLNGDALYQQYKDQYVNQGQQAMMDTMGQAAALTGGYGNSYAQTAGQQTYQGYLQQLNDKVPELYQLALDKYNNDTEDLYNQYSLYSDRDQTDYDRHRDTVSDYYTDRDYLTNVYNNERDFDYTDQVDTRNYGYQVARDAVADEQWQKEFDESVRQFNVSEANDLKASSASSSDETDDGQVVSSDSNDNTEDVTPKATGTDRTTLFANSVQTYNEYRVRNKGKGMEDYKAYIEEKIDEWGSDLTKYGLEHSGGWTEGELAFLEEKFGLDE